MSDVALRAPPRGVGESLELVDAFEARARAVAASAAAPNTRRAYATAYRAFAAFLQARYGEASAQTSRCPRSPPGAITCTRRASRRARSLSASAASVASRVAVGADPLVAQVRCTHVQHERPSVLSDRELSALLAKPDLRTMIGVRDRAILELLARAGLRQVRARASQPRRRPRARPPVRRPPQSGDRAPARRSDPA